MQADHFEGWCSNVLVSDSKMNGLVASLPEWNLSLCDDELLPEDGIMWSISDDTVKRDVISGKVLRYYFSEGKLQDMMISHRMPDGVTNYWQNYSFGRISISDARTFGLLDTLPGKGWWDRISFPKIMVCWECEPMRTWKRRSYFNTSIWSRKYNGNHCLLHWMSDIGQSIRSE